MSSQTIFRTKGATSQSVIMALLQGASNTTPGAPITALTFSGVTCYRKMAATSATALVTLATLASETAAYSSGGFIQLSATNAPGEYRFDLPNDTFTNPGEYDYFFSISPSNALAVHHLKVIVTAVDLFNTLASQTNDLTMGAESYPTKGSLASQNQILQSLRAAMENTGWVPGTVNGVLTVYKLDGVTAAYTITGNDPISPTVYSRTT